jgi:hypothetical protein
MARPPRRFEQVEKELRTERARALLEQFLVDLRVAARSLLRNARRKGLARGRGADASIGMTARGR